MRSPLKSLSPGGAPENQADITTFVGAEVLFDCPVEAEGPQTPMRCNNIWDLVSRRR